MSQELEPTPPDTDVLLVLPAGEVSGHSIPFCFFPHPCLKAMTQAAEKDSKVIYLYCGKYIFFFFF